MHPGNPSRWRLGTDLRPAGPVCALYLCLVLAALPCRPAAAAATAAPNCAGIDVQVSGGPARDRRLVCGGASKALTFLRTQGFGPRAIIRIRLHDRPITDYREHIGLFDAHSGVIDLLTLGQAQRQCARVSPFRTRMDETLYESFVVHEVTHAIVAQQPSDRPVSRLAQEYVAYSAQLATMAPAKRAQILGRYSLKAFAGAQELSATYYALDPSSFGVKAYLHFASLSEPAAFVRGLVTGAIAAGRRDGQH